MRRAHVVSPSGRQMPAVVALAAFLLASTASATGWVEGPLVDVRLDGASAPADAGRLALPWSVTLAGDRWSHLEIGPGWVQPVRWLRVPSVGGAPSAERLEGCVRGPKLDVLSGPGVVLAPGGEVLTRVTSGAAVIRWTALRTPSGSEASVELVLSRLGTVSLQYLRLPAEAARALARGELSAGLDSDLAPRSARSYRLAPRLLRPELPRPGERTLSSGPPPPACLGTEQSWCDVAGGPGDSVVYLDESFDDGESVRRGWSGTGLWREIGYADCTPGATTASGRAWHHGRDDCSNRGGGEGVLASPPFGPVTTATRLTFAMRLESDDRFPGDVVEVRGNGILLGRLENPPDSSTWYAVEPISLATFSGEMVTIDFRYESASGGEVLGWMVDDVLAWDSSRALTGCSINAGRSGATPCEERASDRWDFNEGDFCVGCTYTFYVLVECGREMHLPMLDMEGAEVEITNVLTGRPVSLRCRNDTARFEAGEAAQPSFLTCDKPGCPDPGLERWYGPAFDETAEDGRVAWGFPDCPNIDQFDVDSNGLQCWELPGCGGPLEEVTPGESQVMDCSIEDDSGLCGIYRLDVRSGGFVWSLFANCDGTDRSQFPIFFDCTDAWEAFNPLPELAIANLSASSTCPDVTVSFDLQNIGCADQLGDVPVRIVSSCPTDESGEYVVPGPVLAGESVRVDLELTSSCSPIDVTVTVDPDDAVLECTESETAAACRAARGVDSLSVGACTCVASPVELEDLSTCAGDDVVLDASALGFLGCSPAATIHEWHAADGEPLGTGAVVTVRPESTTTYDVTVRCGERLDCERHERVTVEVDTPPSLGSAAASDVAACNSGLLLEWLAAEFHGGTGVHHVYRSTVSCEDALRREPIALGLDGTRFLDKSAPAGRAVWHVVEAESARASASCLPVGPLFGGAVTRACIGPTVDATRPGTPEPVHSVLRARREADAVSMRWERARALLPGERFVLLVAAASPTSVQRVVDAAGERSHAARVHGERVQYYDLRVANECDEHSEDEYPSTF